MAVYERQNLLKQRGKWLRVQVTSQGWQHQQQLLQAAALRLSLLSSSSSLKLCQQGPHSTSQRASRGGGEVLNM
jgi:hypothetical protein